MLRWITLAAIAALAGCGNAPAHSKQWGQALASDDFMCGGMDARDVLNVIVSQGANLALAREAVFYFYGAEEKLPALQSALERLGFSVRPTRTEPGRIAAIKTVVDEAWLRGMIPKLCATAAANEVEYDGWEASVPEAQKED